MRPYNSTRSEAGDATDAAAAAGAQGGPPPYLRTWNFYDDKPELLEDFPADSPYFRDFFKQGFTALPPLPYQLLTYAPLRAPVTNQGIPLRCSS